jgi:hypothetical protein
METFFWLLAIPIAKGAAALGLKKHGATKVIKELAKEEAKDRVKDAIQNKDNKKKDKED